MLERRSRDPTFVEPHSLLGKMSDRSQTSIQPNLLNKQILANAMQC